MARASRTVGGIALALVVAASLVLLAMSAVASAATLTWGGSGSGPGQFTGVYDVAVAPDGTVYAPDSAAVSRIQHFTAAGAFLNQFGDSGPGALSDPAGVAVAPGGDVYVLDESGVKRFTAAGAYTGDSWPAGNGGIAVDPLGRVYLSQVSPRSVIVYEADGDQIEVLAEEGTQPGKVSYPVDLTIGDDGRVYVLDQRLGPAEIPVPEVNVFDSNGGFVERWKVEVPGSVHPSIQTIAVGPGGDLFSVEGNEVVRFTPTGVYLGAAPIPGNGPFYPYQFYGKIGADDEYVYVSEPGARRILRVDPKTPDAAIAGPGQVLTGDPAGFDASASAVPAGQIVDYAWDLDGDGSFETDTGATPTAARSYVARGAVEVKVRVTSDLGGVTVATHQLAVLPAPPPGPVGVSIEGGARFTNDPQVEVSVRWPRFASDLIIANDGGFFPFSQTLVEATVPWRLDSSGPERLPKTIYVRFSGGESGPETYQDDIILDQTAPALKQVTLRPRGGKRFQLRIKARDGVSGLGRMQVTARKAKPRKWKRFRSALKLKKAPRRLFVRVRDRAGNVSRWRRASRRG